MTKDMYRALFDELEEFGLFVRTGEMRPNREGELEPVYVSAVTLGLITEEEAQRRMQLLSERDKSTRQ